MTAGQRDDRSHRARVWRTPWPGVHATLIESARRYGRHTHRHFGFGVLEDGAQRSASGRGTVLAAAGDVITVNPGEVHDGAPYAAPTRRWRMLYADPALIDALRSESADAGGHAVAGEFEHPVLSDAALRRTIGALFARIDAWQTAGAADGAAAMACDESWVAALSALIVTRAVSPALRPRADTALLRIRDRLADEALQPPSLAELASMAACSRYQLLRRFKAAFGLPPHAWVLQRRVEHARLRIAEGMAIADAAACCGFADQSHLTRLFVRQFGFAPGAWQRAMRRRQR